MEKAYRYLYELACRPESPDDWERALEGLDHLYRTAPLTAFARLGKRLQHQLDGLSARLDGLDGTRGTPQPRSFDQLSPTSASPWLDEYILGVALECEAASPTSDRSDGLQDHGRGSIDEQILRHYQATLAHRPNSFWAHYRAAAMCMRLGRPLDRSAHLVACRNRRPANPAIRGLLSSSLLLQNRLDEALHESDLAIQLDPDFAEYYRTRAWILAELGRSEELRGDIRRFEVLSRIVPAGLMTNSSRTPHQVTKESPKLSIDQSRRLTSQPIEWSRSSSHRPNVTREELDTRFILARVLFKTARDSEQGIAELNKILILAPDYLHARIFRATLFAGMDAFEESKRDLEYALNHPEFSNLIQIQPDTVSRLVDISWHYMRIGRSDEALSLANKALDFAESVNMHIGKSHYAVARALALPGPKSPEQIDRIADHLLSAAAQNHTFLDWYSKDPRFEATRTTINRKFIQLAEASSVAPSVKLSLRRVVATSTNRSH
jgi:tetratricopeptide (TPR) repeat protein